MSDTPRTCATCVSCDTNTAEPRTHAGVCRDPQSLFHGQAVHAGERCPEWYGGVGASAGTENNRAGIFTAGLAGRGLAGRGGAA